jgi:hypothetical protein
LTKIHQLVLNPNDEPGTRCICFWLPFESTEVLVVTEEGPSTISADLATPESGVGSRTPPLTPDGPNEILEKDFSFSWGIHFYPFHFPTPPGRLTGKIFRPPGNPSIRRPLEARNPPPPIWVVSRGGCFVRSARLRLITYQRTADQAPLGTVWRHM